MPNTFKLPKDRMHRVRIDLNDPKCIKAWMECLDVSEKKLRRVIAVAGTTNPLLVRRALDRGLFKAD